MHIVALTYQPEFTVRSVVSTAQCTSNRLISSRLLWTLDIWNTEHCSRPIHAIPRY